MENSGGIRRFWADNGALGLATLVAGLFNTLYSLILAHALGPKNYGWVAALNNLVGLFLLPLPIVGLAAIRMGRQAGQRWLIWAVMGLGAVLFAAALVLSHALGRALRLPPSLVVLFAASVIFTFGYALYVGFLERARHYRLVGLLLVVSSGSAVAAVALAVTVGRRHPIAWLGALQFLSVLLLFWLARRYGEALPDVPPSPLSRAVMATTLGVGTLQSLWGLADSLWAKANLGQVAAGLYTGLSTIGQALPFVVASLATVMLTAVLDEPEHRHIYLMRTLVTAGLMIVVYLGLLTVVPDAIVRLALGRRFLPLVPWIQRYSAAMAALALVSVLTTYGVAVGAYRAMIAAALGTAVWIVSLAGAASMGSLVNRTLWAMAMTLGLVILAFIRHRNGRSPKTEDRP